MTTDRASNDGGMVAHGVSMRRTSPPPSWRLDPWELVRRSGILQRAQECSMRWGEWSKMLPRSRGWQVGGGAKSVKSSNRRLAASRRSLIAGRVRWRPVVCSGMRILRFLRMDMFVLARPWLLKLCGARRG